MTSKQLAHALIDLNMSQADLAFTLGITPNTITVWKRSNKFPKWLELAIDALKSKLGE